MNYPQKEGTWSPGGREASGETVEKESGGGNNKKLRNTGQEPRDK